MGIIDVNAVTYVYRNKWQQTIAVNNVTFEFERGKMYTIVGKSGSGKTTFLSMLAGLDVPTDGEVLFDGRSTKKLDRDLYRRDDVSVVYQNYNLFPLMTVLENVSYPLELYGQPVKDARAKAKRMIEEVGLTDAVYKRYPAMLSGGEQQRVAIARALCSNARVILADEPTGNLDTENSKKVIDILQKLAHENRYCVIIVTHDLSIADRADVILHMKDGRLCHE